LRKGDVFFVFFRILVKKMTIAMEDLSFKDTKERTSYQPPHLETAEMAPEAAVLSASNEHWEEEALWV